MSNDEVLMPSWALHELLAGFSAVQSVTPDDIRELASIEAGPRPLRNLAVHVARLRRLARHMCPGQPIRGTPMLAPNPMAFNTPLPEREWVFRVDFGKDDGQTFIFRHTEEGTADRVIPELKTCEGSFDAIAYVERAYGLSAPS